MNKAIIIGRLTRDPEVRYSQGDNSMAIARFTLAVDRRFKRAGETQEADFISCVAFGKQAEFVEKYFRQGMKMVLSGRIQTGSYTNKDGQKVYTTDVVAEDIEFAESKGSNPGGGDSGYQGNSNNQSNNFRPEPSSAMGDGFMNIPDGIDEELPFN
ncbi:MAG TPA: single-stranded DNA-binding protein [Clostridiales bacterium]|nr:single-stranded DNA-binding protein [Clostridiales bacterium]